MRRIDQLLSSLGYCSRREARAWVEDRRVTHDGQPVDDAGQRCDPAKVRVDGEPLDHWGGLLLLLHKPEGVVCSHDPGEGPRIYDLFPPRWNRRNPPLVSVGRLDRDTTGLLLVTDQSPLAHRLTAPKSKVPKTYRAQVTPPAAPAEQARLREAFASGALLLTGETEACRPAELTWEAAEVARVTVLEGRYHQIRRMFAAQGLTVVKLHRERFGSLDLGDLPAGRWRLLPLDQRFA